MSLRDPEGLDVCSLPAISFRFYRELPMLPAVYFVVDTLGTVRYIGQTKCLRKRWNGPNKPFTPTFECNIAWLEIEQDDERRMLERRLIRRFQPSHNHQGVLPGKPFCHVAICIPRQMYISLDLLSDSCGRTIAQEVVILLDEAIRARNA